MKKIKQIMKENGLKEKEKPKYPIKEYDKNNNLIHYKYSNGYEEWYEYDKNNNEINHKDSNGYE